MRLVLVVPPAAQPITLTEVKAQARVTHDDEDLLLQHYIDAATAWLDGPSGILGRCLVTQTWRAELAAVTGPVQLPFPDSTIDRAVFTDAEGGELAYDVVLHDQPPLLRPSSGAGRPAAITFTAGYGAPAEVPAAIRQAMLLLVTQWYEHRQITGTGNALPFAVEALLAPYRRVRL
ncbi:phage head-tail connector protein [Paracoccus sp. MC1854]|uniref:head-tail connector protein n=1 Tax=Paracoccus sp. MC1854 TaxID=2760306 RepID=UPI001603603A|nr:head-tail connector protein [Paracoccus sp. MC1854]MBB1493313.1 phage head-tail connector protein [Paracoccus sp. MC1854]